LDDEGLAQEARTEDGRRKSRTVRIQEFEAAVRAYIQLEVVLRAQGVIEAANRYAYRAYVLVRQVLRRKFQFARYLGSQFLNLTSGHGYRLMRAFITYLVTISVFALLYWCVTNNVSLIFGCFTQIITWMGMAPPPPSTTHLQGYEALVVSMTSFHGRGSSSRLGHLGTGWRLLPHWKRSLGYLLRLSSLPLSPDASWRVNPQ
jgi:hypothetical protein